MVVRGSRVAPGPGPVLAIDLGSTNVRLARFDVNGRQTGEAVQLRHRPSRGPAGQLNPHDLLHQLVSALHQIDTDGVQAVGFSVIWQTALEVDPRLRPLGAVRTWEDSAQPAKPDTPRLSAEAAESHRLITGSYLHPSYPLSQRLLLDEEAGGPTSAAPPPTMSHLASWLVAALTGSDPGWSEALASGSGLWDQDRRAWLPTPACATLRSQPLWASAHRATHPSSLLPPGLRDAAWLPALPDGLCHNLGLGAVGTGDVTLTVATSGSVRAVLTAGRAHAPRGLWEYRCGPTTTAVGGAITSLGNTLEWVERLTRRPVDFSFAAAPDPQLPHPRVQPDVYGRRGPDYSPIASGAINNLGPADDLASVGRAFAVDIWKQFVILVRLMSEVTSPELLWLGGGVVNRWPQAGQLLADALGRPLQLSSTPQAALRGAALYAGQHIRRGSDALDDLVADITTHGGELDRGALLQPRPAWTHALNERWAG